MSKVASGGSDDGTYDVKAWNWDHYQQFRPRYPPSTIQYLIAYHQQHRGKQRLAHDVGSGHGVFVPELATRFSHVHVSDPGEQNLAHARESLTQWLASSKSAATITFSKMPGEEAHLCFPRQTVDFMTVMEAAHWTDGDLLAKAAAESLAPGGTLAVVYYGGLPYIEQAPKSLKALQALVGGLYRHVRQDSEVVTRATANVALGINFIPTPADIFIDVKRININAQGRRDIGYMDDAEREEVRSLPSRAAPGEEVIEIDDEHSIAKDWTLQVNQDWFLGYVQSLFNGYDIVGRAEYKQLRQALIEEHGSAGKVSVGFVCFILLASRR